MYCLLHSKINSINTILFFDINKTPLYYAIDMNDFEVVKVLLSHKYVNVNTICRIKINN